MGRAEPRDQPQPRSPSGPRGGRPGEKDASRAGHRPAARARSAGARPPRHTHPPAAPTTPRRATPAAAVARAGGEAAIAPGRGAARARGAEGARREDGARSLLEHGLLLLLFFLLAIHDGQDDLPLLFREVAEVRHLGLRRRLRGRRGGHRPAPGPERSRHVGWSRTTLGKQGGNSAGSGGSGAGGSGSLGAGTKTYKSMAFNRGRQPPSPPGKEAGGGEARGRGSEAVARLSRRLARVTGSVRAAEGEALGERQREGRGAAAKDLGPNANGRTRGARPGGGVGTRSPGVPTPPPPPCPCPPSRRSGPLPAPPPPSFSPRRLPSAQARARPLLVPSPLLKGPDRQGTGEGREWDAGLGVAGPKSERLGWLALRGPCAPELSGAGSRDWDDPEQVGIPAGSGTGKGHRASQCPAGEKDGERWQCLGPGPGRGCGSSGNWAGRPERHWKEDAGDGGDSWAGEEATGRCAGPRTGPAPQRMSLGRGVGLFGPFLPFTLEKRDRS
ncbi:hypothetical protein ACRRTK_023309 [Alexandromys fortis]